MSEARHTPGPWHRGERLARAVVYDARGWAVADAKVYHNREGIADRIEANADLIAAAPEMYAELELNRVTLARLCMAVLQCDLVTAEEIARDVKIDFKSGEPKVYSPAIAKAEGRQV